MGDFTDTLRQAFFDGTIRGGQSLTEEGLSRSYGVSRTPVREALIRLESEGLVTIIKNKGAFARQITPTDVVEIFQLRGLLEGYAARTCVETIDRNRLLALYEEMKALPLIDATKEDHDRLGHELHDLISDTSPNERFRNLAKSLRWQFVWAKNLIGYIPKRRNKTLREHLKIAEQILAGNPSKAEKAMTHHLHAAMVDIVSPDNIHIFSIVNQRDLA